jgi:ketosteroid isomerase-like protein
LHFSNHGTCGGPVRFEILYGIDAEWAMHAKSPEDICRLFRHCMAEGDLESLLSLYDPEAAFLTRTAEVKHGREGLRQELAPFAAAKARFDFDIRQVVQAGDIALMHTSLGPQSMAVHAIEVARRQPDGTWRWLIGDPFTVGRLTGT